MRAKRPHHSTLKLTPGDPEETMDILVASLGVFFLGPDVANFSSQG